MINRSRKQSLQDFINDDELVEAVQFLKEEYNLSRSETRLLDVLTARTIENESKFSEGILSRKDYLLEKNKIRVSLLSIQKPFPKEKARRQSFFYVILLGFIIVVSLIVLYTLGNKVGEYKSSDISNSEMINKEESRLENILLDFDLNVSPDYVKKKLGISKRSRMTNATSVDVWEFDDLWIEMSVRDAKIQRLEYYLPEGSKMKFTIPEFVFGSLKEEPPTFGDLDIGYLHDNFQYDDGWFDPLDGSYGFYHCFHHTGIAVNLVAKSVVRENELVHKKLEDIFDRLKGERITSITFKRCKILDLAG